MRCPRCDERLEAYEPQRRVVAHACPAGEGALLLRADLERALPVAALAALADASPTRAALNVPAGPSCPACAAPMTERALARHGDRIDLDACDACGAIWFDSGELSRAQAPPQAGPSAAAHSLHGSGARAFAGDGMMTGAMVVADPGIWHAIAGFIAMLFDN